MVKWPLIESALHIPVDTDDIPMFVVFFSIVTTNPKEIAGDISVKDDHVSLYMCTSYSPVIPSGNLT